MPGEFNWPVRVYYEDTDAAGIVFYANYLRYMERARTEWLRSVGYEHEMLKNTHGILFAVKNVSIEYVKPACLDDLLTVYIDFIKKTRRKLDLSTSIIKNEEQRIANRGRGESCLPERNNIKGIGDA